MCLYLFPIHLALSASHPLVFSKGPKLWENLGTHTPSEQEMPTCGLTFPGTPKNAYFKEPQPEGNPIY